jgi:hypothetical protein
MHDGEIRAFRDTYSDVLSGDEIDIGAHASDPASTLSADAL